MNSVAPRSKRTNGGEEWGEEGKEWGKEEKNGSTRAFRASFVDGLFGD